MLTTPVTALLVLPAWSLYVGLGALGLGLVALVGSLAALTRPAPMTPGDRVTTYTELVAGAGAGGAATARRAPDPVLSQAADAADQVLRRHQPLEERISARLEAAGSELKSSEWLLVHVGTALGALVLGLLLGEGSLLLGVVLLVLGAVLPWVYLGVRRSRRRKAFSTSLPDTLQLMAGALSAGLSLPQSVDTIVREGPEPIASEFRRVLVETRLGVGLEDSLEQVAQRFESSDFAWVVMAVRIQRQVGGNLAELLETVAATMREREYLRRQVSALSAEGRLSAWVLGALPPAFMLYLLVANRAYVMPLFTDPRGLVMIIGAGLWLGVGVFWMSRLVRVEV